MKEHTVITISRQYGSGGREIAEILAKKMQVRCYDRQIVYLAAEKIGNGDLDVESILEEAYRLPGTQRGLWGNFSFGSNVIPDYNQMYKEQAMLIKKLAENPGEYFWDAVQMPFFLTGQTVIIFLFMQTICFGSREAGKNTAISR